MRIRNFIKKTAFATGGILIMNNLFAKPAQKIYGHNNMQYTLDTAWVKPSPANFPVNDCHEMVQDSKGSIILLTNETKNNFLVFNKDGKVIDSWGHDFPSGYGLTLHHNENGIEYLYVTDTEKHHVYKTSMQGQLLLTISAPVETGIYKKAEEFVPTETAIADNQDIFIADGYGLQFILQYDNKGKLRNYFGGKGDSDNHLDNAHGICFDTRNSKNSLLITDRTRNRFKEFDRNGKLLEVIKLPGACVCRPVIKGDYLYAAVLRLPDLKSEKTGFVTVSDKQNKVVSNIGGSEPHFIDGTLQPMQQTDKIFLHPHDVCIDRDENIYVAQWASGKLYPYKLIRV